MELENFWLISGTLILIAYGLGKFLNIFMIEWMAFAALVVMVTAVLELHLDLRKKFLQGRK